MTTSNAALEVPRSAKLLSSQEGDGATMVNGFDVPSNLMEFVHSDKFLTLAVDPAKTITPEISMAKLLFHAKLMAPERDGIRRSRAVWVSNTQERLREIEEAFLKAFPGSVPDCEIGRDHTFTLLLGDDVECEILFRVYNKHEDVSSMPHASFYIFDDLLNADSEVFLMSASRIGLYPDRKNGPGCVTEDGERNKIVWAVSSTPNGEASYWDNLIANNDEVVHMTRLP